MIYRRVIPVEFNHCDPAGIVFYPRYFEMTNSVVENFFAEVAGDPFADMVRRREGVPTARIDVDFRAPSRLGDRLDWALEVQRLGSSSLTLQLTAGDPVRLTAHLTLVRVGPDGRPVPWSQLVRDRISAFSEADG